MRRDLATAPIAASGLIAGFGVAAMTGSRELGGLVLAACGLVCMVVWLERDGGRTAATLTAVGLLAFALSHLLGLVIGAWPAVLLAAAGIGIACWRRSDSRRAVTLEASALRTHRSVAFATRGKGSKRSARR
ncbi:MAG: hypothetical protein ACR2OB_05805 [Solirubrobacteraceae bacterium]